MSLINAAVSLDAVLAVVTEEARHIIGTHQSVTSITRGEGWSQAINTVSLSDTYAEWRDYEALPDGSGIYAMVCEPNARPA